MSIGLASGDAAAGAGSFEPSGSARPPNGSVNFGSSTGFLAGASLGGSVAAGLARSGSAPWRSSPSGLALKSVRACGNSGPGEALIASCTALRAPASSGDGSGMLDGVGTSVVLFAALSAAGVGGGGGVSDGGVGSGGVGGGGVTAVGSGNGAGMEICGGTATDAL